MKKEEQPTRRRRKWPLMLTLAVLLFAMAGGIYWFLTGLKGASGGEAQASATGAVKNVTLETFTVNLADPGARRYLRATITLEYTGKELEKELATRDYRVRDAIIGVLRTKTVADLSTPEKIVDLRRELVDAINAVLEKSRVTDVFFREFIIQ